MAQRMYRRLAEAAARVHGKDVELVTFHEFGDLDCLVEMVGCALALSMLGVERVFASSIPTGLGMIRTEHGITPIPSPVVLELLQGAPTYSRGIPVELVTPTGAAILAAVSEGYGEMPLMLADRVGYGAGHLRLDFPNVLRVVIGAEQRAGARAEPTAPMQRFVLEVTMDADRRDAVNLDVLSFDLEFVDRDASDRHGDRVEIGAGVHQSAQRHVPGDPREAVEVRDAH